MRVGDGFRLLSLREEWTEDRTGARGGHETRFGRLQARHGRGLKGKVDGGGPERLMRTQDPSTPGTRLSIMDGCRRRYASTL
jgi:hypothetical protein